MHAHTHARSINDCLADLWGREQRGAYLTSIKGQMATLEPINYNKLTHTITQ